MGEVAQPSNAEGATKCCTKCGVTKPVSEFYKEPNGKYGVRADCKECNKAKTLGWSRENPDYYKNYRAENHEKELARLAAYRADNPEKTRESSRKWRAKNPDAWKKRYWKDHEKTLAKAAVRRDKNRERYRRYAREYIGRYRETPKGKLESSIRSGVWKGIIHGSKAGRKTFELLGYTVERLKGHLEMQFQPGMSWENCGRNGWHIDHKIPLSVHNYNTPDDPDFKRAWALKNLQPMWEPENISKGAKLEAEFQPSLAMPMPANDNVEFSKRVQHDDYDQSN
jgi:hypothetical protein